MPSYNQVQLITIQNVPADEMTEPTPFPYCAELSLAEAGTSDATKNEQGGS